jgi:hypothetical protein
MERWREIVGTVVLLGGLLWHPSGSSAQSACGCTQQDKTDLESRIKQVDAAMKEYDALIKEWETKEKGAGEPLLLTHTNRGSIQSSVGFKMSGVRLPNARSFGAETDPTCAVSIDPAATACLRGALQEHESVHKKACDANKSVNPFVDWRSKQRLVDYMKEEKAGYQKELDRLNDELTKMQKHCSKITQLDPSAQRLLQQAIAQRERFRSAADRLQMYGKAVN